MSKTSKKKFAGYDPAAKARQEAEIRRDPSRWGANVAALDLPANATVQHTPGTREKVERRQRFDVFHLLHARGGLAYSELTSARLLQDEIATRHGLDDKGPTGSGNGSVEIYTARKIEAAAKVDALLDWCGKPFAQLLTGLCEPLAYGHAPNWRKIVECATAEHRHVQQAEAVREACQALTASYARWDSGERPAKRLRVAA